MSLHHRCFQNQVTQLGTAPLLEFVPALGINGLFKKTTKKNKEYKELEGGEI